AEKPDSSHDMGGDIIPALVEQGRAYVYDFARNVVPGATERDRGYWRDVGTIGGVYGAHMDLVSVHPVFNLYHYLWPIRTQQDNLPPAKFVKGGMSQESMVGAGSIISAGTVRNSVVAGNVTVEEGAVVEGSVLLPGARIGRGAVVRRAIVDKNSHIGDGDVIGVDHDRDRKRFPVSVGGVVSVAKNTTTSLSQ